jgi:hypothetical protein
MVDNFRKTVIASGAVGMGTSLALFFASWWMHAFDLLVVPQFPGFLISSFLWGYPGFAHNSSSLGGAVFFPYLDGSCEFIVLRGDHLCRHIYFKARDREAPIGVDTGSTTHATTPGR